MPDPTDPSRLTMAIRNWVEASYPAAVVRRFFDLELLDKSFVLAAQAFVALLPLVIVVVSLFVADSGDTIANAIGNRFGLDSAAQLALRALFAHPTIATVNWLAVVVSLLSAFSLSRRLARVYAAIFAVTPLPRKKNWHGLVWIVLQVALLVGASMLRDVRIGSGPVLAAVAFVALLVLWFVADMLGLLLLVPAAPRRMMAASAVLSSLGRAGMAVWSFLYLSKSLERQAEQFGPIGVTFGIFTYLLVAALVYVGAPLLVTTWQSWRAGTVPAVPTESVVE